MVKPCIKDNTLVYRFGSVAKSATRNNKVVASNPSGGKLVVSNQYSNVLTFIKYINRKNKYRLTNIELKKKIITISSKHFFL